MDQIIVDVRGRRRIDRDRLAVRGIRARADIIALERSGHAERIGDRMLPAQCGRSREVGDVGHRVPFRVSGDRARLGELRVRVAGVDSERPLGCEQRLEFRLEAIDARITPVGRDAVPVEIGRDLRIGPALVVGRDVGDHPAVEPGGFLADLVIPHRVRVEGLGRGHIHRGIATVENLCLQGDLVALQRALRRRAADGWLRRDRLVRAT